MLAVVAALLVLLLRRRRAQEGGNASRWASNVTGQMRTLPVQVFLHHPPERVLTNFLPSVWASHSTYGTSVAVPS